MRWGLRLAALLLPASVLATQAIELKERQNTCTNIVIQQIITTEVITFPVLVNGFYPQNTVLTIVGGPLVTIGNAPTFLQTVVLASSTATNTAVTTVMPNTDGGNSVQVYVQYSQVFFPVPLSTFIQQNTIINHDGVTIVINNAPTTLITTATGTSTVTSTVTTTVAPTGANGNGQLFILSPVVNAAAKRDINRRQNTGGVIGAGGKLVPSCNDATLFSLQGTSLSSGGQLVAANPGDASIRFAPGGGGTITTIFTANNFLVWANARFQPSGNAIFSIEDGYVVAHFDGQSGTGAVRLSVIPQGQCQDGQLNPTIATTGASTTTGTVTSSGSSTGSSTGLSTGSTTGSTTDTASSTSTGTGSSSATASSTSTGSASTSSSASTSGSSSTSSTMTTLTTVTVSTTSTSTSASSTSSSCPARTLSLTSNACVCVNGATDACCCTGVGQTFTGNACACLDGFLPSIGEDSALLCTRHCATPLVLDLETGLCGCGENFSLQDGICVTTVTCNLPGQTYNSDLNTCVCADLFQRDATANGGTGLVCTPSAACAENQQVNLSTGVCACLAGFHLVGGVCVALSKDVVCQGEGQTESAPGLCMCLDGFTDSGLLSSGLDCVSDVAATCNGIGVYLDGTTGLCVCRPGFTQTALNAGIPTCIVDTTLTCTQVGTQLATLPEAGIAAFCTCRNGLTQVFVDDGQGLTCENDSCDSANGQIVSVITLGCVCAAGFSQNQAGQCLTNVVCV